MKVVGVRILVLKYQGSKPVWLKSQTLSCNVLEFYHSVTES